MKETKKVLRIGCLLFVIAGIITELVGTGWYDGSRYLISLYAIVLLSIIELIFAIIEKKLFKSLIFIVCIIFFSIVSFLYKKKVDARIESRKKWQKCFSAYNCNYYSTLDDDGIIYECNAISEDNTVETLYCDKDQHRHYFDNE